MSGKNTFALSPFDELTADLQRTPRPLPGQEPVILQPELAAMPAAAPAVAAPAAPVAAPRRAAVAVPGMPTAADLAKRATELGVDPKLALSILNAESGGNFATKDSPKGAVGPLQVMPGTYRQMMGTDEGLRDPWKNMEAGLRYIAFGQQKLGTKDPALLAAGYQSGYNRDSLKRGEIPNTTDGLSTTADYARKVAKGVGAKSPEEGRFIPLSAEEVAAYEASQKPADEGRFIPLSPEEVAAYEAKNKGPSLLDDLKDTGRNLKVGANSLAENVRELTGRIPGVGPAIVSGLDRVDELVSGKKSEALLKGDTESLTKSMTPQMQAAQDKKWWDSDAGRLGPAWTDWRSYASGLVQSLPAQAVTMGPAMVLAKAAYGAKIAAGAAVNVASQSAARTALVAGALSEGTLGGADASRAVREKVNALPLEALAQSDAFKALRSQGMDDAQARKALAEDSATRAFVMAGVATGAFGGMGDRAIAKLFTEAVGRGVVRRALTGVGKGTVAEGVLEELPQSALGQVAQNAAVQRADPSQKLSEDVLNQGLGGLAIGAAQGGAMGGASASLNVNRNGVPAAVAPQAPVAAARIEPTMGPASPPAAGPLSAAMQTAAAPAAPAAIVTAPTGEQVAGQVTAVQEDGQGGFMAQIVTDDGEVLNIDQRSGAQITLAPAAPSGPLTAAVERAAAGQPDPVPVEPPPAAEDVAPTQEALDLPDATRLYIESAGAAADPDVPAFIESSRRALAEEKQSDPDTWTPEQRQLQLDDWRAFSRSRGYTEAEIENFGRSLDLARKLDGKYGPGFSEGLMQEAPDAAPAPDAGPAPADSGEPPVASPQQEPQEDARWEPVVQPAEVDIADMDEPALRARLKYIATQAKNSGGWDKRMMAERRRVENEITKRVAAEPEAPAVTPPAADAVAATPAEAPAATPQKDAPAAPASAAGAERAAGKWFNSPGKADQRLEEWGLSDTHEVVKTGKVRYEIKPKAAVAPAKSEAPAKVAEVAKPAAASPQAAPSIEAETQALTAQFQANVAAKADKPKPLTGKAKAKAEEAAIADFYTPGNIVSGYGGGADRVLSFDPVSREVYVQSMKRQGDAWVEDGEPPRMHTTRPTDRELRAGPLQRAAPAPAEPKKAVTPKPRRKPAKTKSGKAAPVVQAVTLATDTPGFKRFFSGSKAVDPSGRPQVYYHGTAADIRTFDPAKRGSNTKDKDAFRGFFFSTSTAVASEYGEGAAADDGANVMPVYLALRNPLVVDHKAGRYDGSAFARYISEAEEQGRDGVIIRNVYDGMDLNKGHLGDTAIAFESSQVKSAIGNNGDFDPGNPDIRMSVDARAADEGAAGPVREALRAGPTGQVIESLIDSGRVVVHATKATMPEAIRNSPGLQASTDQAGVIHLNAESLTPATANAVLLHEAFHGGVESLIGSARWNRLQSRLGGLYRQAERSSGRAREFFDKGRARVAAAADQGSVAPKYEVEEFGAYAIEEYERAPATVRKWVDDLAGAVKAWMLSRFGRQLGAVTPSQLRALSVAALRSMATGVQASADAPRQSVAADADASAFRRWFGKSQVVDQEGAPLRVYHVTDQDVNAFKTMGNRTSSGEQLDAAFFTSSEDYAESYAYEKKGGSVRTIPAFLSLQNPLRASLSARDFADPRAERPIIDRARAEGYDGVIFTDAENGDEFFAAFSPGQIKSAIGNNGEFDPANPDIRMSVAAKPAPASLKPAEQGFLRRTQSTIQDQWNRVAEVQKQIAKAAGIKEVAEDQDYLGAERNRPGRIAARLEDARNQVTSPMMQRLAKSGSSVADLEELLHAQHAKERNKKIAEFNPAHDPASPKYSGTQASGMNDDKADAIIAKHAGNKELQAIAIQAREITRKTLDLKLAYGLIDKETHDTLTHAYRAYVPLKGDIERGSKIKRAMGHGERDEHIVENIARDYEQAYVTGEKNLARQTLLSMVLRHPDPDLWTVGAPPKGRYIAGMVYTIRDATGKIDIEMTSKNEVRAYLEGAGAAAVNLTVTDSKGERVAEFTKPLQDNEVMVYVDGQPIRIQIKDEKLASQIRPLRKEQMGVVLEGMRSLNRYLSRIYTGANPAFILKNAVRDLGTGTINILGNQGAGVAAKAWANYLPAAKALGTWAATGKLPPGKIGVMLQEYRMSGGKTGASYMSDLEQQAETLQQVFDDTLGVAKLAKDGEKARAAGVAGRKLIGGMAHIVEVANQATENALRLGLYMALRDKGVSPGKSAQAAKTVTVDFDRKGTATPTLGAIYLFMNPAIQGTANGMRTLFYGEHKAQAWAALGGLAAAGLFASSAGMDDDKDRWLGEAWDSRTRNFILTVGDHRITIPMSQEFTPFYAFGVAIGEALRGESPMKSAGHMVSSFIDAYFPLSGAWNPEGDSPGADAALAAVPTVFKPWVQSAVNRSSFGTQIVPETDNTKDRPDNLKMNRGTKNSVFDKTAQGIAKGGELIGMSRYEADITKVSPETLKHLWRTYTGGLGQFVTDTAGLGINLATDREGIESSGVPFVKDFWKPNDVKAIRGRFHEQSKDVRRAAGEFALAKKLGDDEALDALDRDPTKMEFLSLAKLVQQQAKAASALRDQAVEVNADKSLSDVEKRKQLKALEKEEEAVYRDGLEAFKK